MNKIGVLDEKTAGQIAAGEVIERPAGVLKELLENAIDAGATNIHIDIEGGGRELIRINDNGCGMSPQDLAASVLRHATSKIKTFQDLNTLRSFGFRGEALYSVAAVSKMRLTSCTQGGEGSRLEVQGGKIIAQSPAPAIAGTTVEISDLFFNVPARLKFLKSPAYERACLLKVVEESALANLKTAYAVVSSGREVYRFPAQENDDPQAVIARAKEILGCEVGESLIWKKFEQWGLKIFITPPDKLVATRDLQFVFVNRRPVESKTIQQAIYKAYQNLRPKDRHPAFIVYVETDPSSFDVNIHPQKRDIRFADERAVFMQMLEAVEDTIFSAATPVAAQVRPAPVALDMPAAVEPALQTLACVTPAPAESTEIFNSGTGDPLSMVQENNSFSCTKPVFQMRETEDPVDYRAVPAASFNNSSPKPHSAAGSDQAPAPLWWKGPYRYLGQIQQTYLVFENPEGVVLIDQHAAQERVLYEKYLQAFEENKIVMQELIFPIHIDLPPSNAEALMSWADWLKTAGFELSLFSARTVLVNAFPAMMRFKQEDIKSFIESLSQVAADSSKSTDILKKKMVAMMACKKAVKAHDTLTSAEAQALLENMKKCKDGMHCPHGRACVVVWSVKEIAKLFGR